jgi:hypothetical protein
LAALSNQKIAYVSFERMDNLQVYLNNLDTGAKTVVTEDIKVLTLSGRMAEDAASLRFFLRNPPSRTGDIIFDDFYASTPIILINIQVLKAFSNEISPKHSFISSDS